MRPGITSDCPELLRRAGFVQDAEALAEQLHEPYAAIVSRARADLDEMAAAHSGAAVALFNRFGRLLLRSYTLEVDRSGLARVQGLDRQSSLVFLPNHRSYLDPFALRATLLAAGLQANHTFGGDNMAWWPMGGWMRRTGNIVLRRSIGDDPVYKLVLREYLARLIERRQNLEWYIEGGRTRTGKLRPPRYGLVGYLLDAFDTLPEGARDVQLVPVSFVYEGLGEVRTLVAEQRGLAKSPETAAWLLKYPRVAGRGLGKIHVRFGEPLALSQPHQRGDGERRNRVEKAAFEICHRINRATPVTSAALVTLAMLAVDDRALTLEQIERLTAPLVDYFNRRAMPVAGSGVGQDSRRQLLSTIDSLAASGVVQRFDGGLEPIWWIAPERHLEAAFYRNTVVHFLVDRAIVELVLAAAAEGAVVGDAEAWQEALRLRALLEFEFFFPDKRSYRRELEAALDLIAEDWRERVWRAHEARELLECTHPHVAHRALHAFFEAYVVLAERLEARSPEERVDGRIVDECLGVARQRRLQHRLSDSDAISAEVLGNAFKLAGHRGLVEPGGEELSVRRAAFADELRVVLHRLDTMRELAGLRIEPEPVHA